MAQQDGTYSFLDFTMVITGPGGTINIGAGAGTADEGVTIEYTDPQGVLTTGSDGTAMHTLRAARPGVITVRLLKTSPTNALLSAMFDYQLASGSGAWGLNVITGNNRVTGDKVVGEAVAFERKPSSTHATAASTLEWRFIVGRLDSRLGGVGIVQS